MAVVTVMFVMVMMVVVTSQVQGRQMNDLEAVRGGKRHLAPNSFTQSIKSTS